MRLLQIVIFLGSLVQLYGCGFFYSKKSDETIVKNPAPSELEQQRLCELGILHERGFSLTPDFMEHPRAKIFGVTGQKSGSAKKSDLLFKTYATLANDVMGKLLKPLELPIHVYIEAKPSKQIFSAAVSKNGVLLSQDIFRRVKFENELAFILARSVAAARSGVGYKCIWDTDAGKLQIKNEPVNETQNADLDVQAIRLLYEAHYDPRSAISVIVNLDPAPPNRAGKFDPNEIRLQMTRQEIARLSPIRDPIVSGEVFKEKQRSLTH